MAVFNNKFNAALTSCVLIKYIIFNWKNRINKGNKIKYISTSKIIFYSLLTKIYTIKIRKKHIKQRIRRTKKKLEGI